MPRKKPSTNLATILRDMLHAVPTEWLLAELQRRNAVPRPENPKVECAWGDWIRGVGDSCKANGPCFQWGFLRHGSGVDIKVVCPAFLRGPLTFHCDGLDSVSY